MRDLGMAFQHGSSCREGGHQSSMNGAPAILLCWKAVWRPPILAAFVLAPKWMPLLLGDDALIQYERSQRFFRAESIAREMEF
jgi:hypothetical protein